MRKAARYNKRHARDAVIIEKGFEGYGAHLPDLPGVINVGDSQAHLMVSIRERSPST